MLNTLLSYILFLSFIVFLIPFISISKQDTPALPSLVERNNKLVTVIRKILLFSAIRAYNLWKALNKLMCTDKYTNYTIVKPDDN